MQVKPKTKRRSTAQAQSNPGNDQKSGGPKLRVARVDPERSLRNVRNSAAQPDTLDDTSRNSARYRRVLRATGLAKHWWSAGKGCSGAKMENTKIIKEPELSETQNRIRFTKMTGSGNDFIIIDNRVLKLEKERGRELARLACRRRMSVGADGLILIENDSEADFRWQFFNADGSEAEMCGNGARCAARFALIEGDSKRGAPFFQDACRTYRSASLRRTSQSPHDSAAQPGS